MEDVWREPERGLRINSCPQLYRSVERGGKERTRLDAEQYGEAGAFSWVDWGVFCFPGTTPLRWLVGIGHGVLSRTSHERRLWMIDIYVTSSCWVSRCFLLALSSCFGCIVFSSRFGRMIGTAWFMKIYEFDEYVNCDATSFIQVVGNGFTSSTSKSQSSLQQRVRSSGQRNCYDDDESKSSSTALRISGS